MKKNMVIQIAVGVISTAIFLNQFVTPAHAVVDLSKVELLETKSVIDFTKTDVLETKLDVITDDKQAQETLTKIAPKSTKNLKVSTFYQFPVKAEDFKGLSTMFTSYHPGYDIRAVYGAEIHPAAIGKVATVEFEAGGYGRYVIVDHGNGIQTLYAHMSKTEVKVGDEVGMDTVIGYVGLTGHTTGPHIHMEVRTNDRRINPSLILPAVAAKASDLALNK